VLTLAYTALLMTYTPLALDFFVVRVGMPQLDVRRPEHRVVLINPRDREPPFQVGAPFAFRSGEHVVRNLRTISGLYLGTMIAPSGARVEFTPDLVLVNGIAHPADPMLPHQGALIVPPGRVFVWPLGLRIAPGSDAERLQLAQGFVIRDSALVGRPYKRWFWRTLNPSLP
jgi:hypothetical protein